MHKRRTASVTDEGIVERAQRERQVRNLAVIIVQSDDLAVITGGGALDQDVSSQRHRLAERTRTCEIVVSHQISLVILCPRKPVVLKQRISGADVKILGLNAIV